MATCQNCYSLANANPRHWFAQPCYPEHELVYAKRDGYSYWPAKVIHYVDSEHCDMQFFGGLHQREVIPKDQIKPIDTDLKKLSIKRTSEFADALEELKFYQELLSEAEQEEGEEEEVQTGSSTDEYTFSGEDTKEPPKKWSRLSTNNTASQTSEKRISTSETSTQTDEPVPSVTTETTTSSSQSVATETPVTEETKASDEATALIEEEPAVLDTGDDSGTMTCNCSAKYTKMMSDQKDRLDRAHKEDRQRALDELSEQLRKDFEEDKQQAVSRAMSKLQTELDKVRRQTEERCKEQYKDEMKKLAQKRDHLCHQEETMVLQL